MDFPQSELGERLKLLSFDVFGTLIDVRQGSYAAFRRILNEVGAFEVDVKAFWESWERRNVKAYWASYRPYKEVLPRKPCGDLRGIRSRGPCRVDLILLRCISKLRAVC